MSELKIICYKSFLQNNLERFISQTNVGPEFTFDLNNKHKDFRNIPDIYQVNEGEFWLLMNNDEVIGMVALKSLSETEGEVKRLNVHPDYRGHGYGEILLKNLLDYANFHKFKRIKLDSNRKQKTAIQIYRKLGFYEIDRYNDNPNADIFMALELDNK